MKSKNFIVNGLFALFLVAAFAQCDGNNAANTPAPQPLIPNVSSPF